MYTNNSHCYGIFGNKYVTNTVELTLGVCKNNAMDKSVLVFNLTVTQGRSGHIRTYIRTSRSPEKNVNIY